jgi:hypothetical protein
VRRAVHAAAGESFDNLRPAFVGRRRLRKVPHADTNQKTVLAKRTHLKPIHEKEKRKCFWPVVAGERFPICTLNNT